MGVGAWNRIGVEQNGGRCMEQNRGRCMEQNRGGTEWEAMKQKWDGGIEWE